MPFQNMGDISTMPKSQIVPVPRTALADPVICVPASGKPVSKLSGSMARQEARRIVLDHVAKRQCREPSSPSVLRKSRQITLRKPAPSSSLFPSFASPVAASPPTCPPLGTQKVTSPPACRSPRVAVTVVPVMTGRNWQCVSCTYEQDYVPGSRTCVMCHSTRRRSHCHRVVVQKTNLVVRTRLVRYSCPNCRLAERCKPCLVSRRQKCIDEIMQY